MKRPLLAVCALLVCLIALWQTLFPPDLAEHALAGNEVYLYGRVESKEHRLSNGQSKSILYLSNVTMCPVEAIDSPTSWNNFSKEFKENRTEIAQNILHNISPSNSPSNSPNMGAFILPLKEQVMATLYAKKTANIGSYVLLQGQVYDFELPRNEGEFHHRLYYASLGIGMQMFEGKLLWQSKDVDWVLEGMWLCKQTWADVLISGLGDRNGSVLATILFGSKERLDSDVKQLYQNSGISHILAISGLHMSLVGMSLYSLARKLRVPRWLAALIGITCIVLYGVFTGAGVSAIRAAGMFVIRMLAILLGRNYDMLTSLGVLMVALVIQNPLYLYHAGFLLSFGAMVGIGCIYPILLGDEKIGKYREGISKFLYDKLLGLKQALIVSFSVQVTTLPIMCLCFYEIAPYSLILNLFVLPLVPVLFVLGIILVMVSSTEIYPIFCALTDLVLNWCTWIADLSLRIPCSKMIVGGVSRWQVLFYVAILGMLILWGKSFSRQGCYKLLFIGIISMTVAVNFKTEITYIDVGQGDGIFVRTLAGNVFMIDGGSSSEKDIGKYTISTFLKSKGVREIDAWIITHPDADHCNGLRGTLENGYKDRVRKILLPDIAKEYRESSYLDLISLAEEFDIPVYFLSAGMRWEEDELSFLCLHPSAEFGSRIPEGDELAQSSMSTNAQSSMSANEYSIVLYIEMKQANFLLTGDVEGIGEEMLTWQLQKYGIHHVNVLKVSHHGSKHSTTDSFLNSIDADLAIISCGENNWYGHPHQETLSRLRKDGAVILTTPKCGQISVEVGMRVRREVENEVGNEVGREVENEVVNEVGRGIGREVEIKMFMGK